MGFDPAIGSGMGAGAKNLMWSYPAVLVRINAFMPMMVCVRGFLRITRLVGRTFSDLELDLPKMSALKTIGIGR